MKVGFTGTFRGMSENQIDWMIQLFQFLSVEEFHHGCCVGSDHQAHRMARAHRIPIHGHPPKNPKAIMPIVEAEFAVLWPPDDYLPRDRRIVDLTSFLIGTPHGDKEVIRSGTWYTIRYARKQRKLHLVVPR